MQCTMEKEELRGMEQGVWRTMDKGTMSREQKWLTQGISSFFRIGEFQNVYPVYFRILHTLIWSLSPLSPF